MSYIKWCKFYNNNSSVILGSKKRGMLKLVNPKHENWASIQLLTLSLLTFLFTLPRFKVIFHWKQTREKLGNAWSAWRNFRVDLAWHLGKSKVGKEIMIQSTYWKILKSLSRRRLFYDMKKKLCNPFILKCVSITTISTEHYMEGIIR